MHRFSANLSTMFTELPFKARFEAAARCGFKAVEFWFPYEWPETQVLNWLRTEELQCVGINSPAGDLNAGDWGLAASSSRKDAFRDSVKLAFDYAVALQCPAVHVMAGMVDEKRPDPMLNATYLDNIRYAAELAAELGKTVLIEPLNPIDRPGYLLWRQSQARDVIAAIGAPNVKIMLDLYHVQMTEGRLVDNVHENAGSIGHIQVADVPGRHEPGTGEINWERVFNAIAESGYRGWLGCEHKPAGTTEHGLDWISSVAQRALLKKRAATNLKWARASFAPNAIQPAG